MGQWRAFSACVVRAISNNVFMIFIYLNIFIRGVSPWGGGGFHFPNDMQMGCNVLFCLKPVRESCGVFICMHLKEKLTYH